MELGSEAPARGLVTSLTSELRPPALMGVAGGAQAGGSTELLCPWSLSQAALSTEWMDMMFVKGSI